MEDLVGVLFVERVRHRRIPRLAKLGRDDLHRVQEHNELEHIWRCLGGFIGSFHGDVIEVVLLK